MRYRLLTTAAIALIFSLGAAGAASAVMTIPAAPSRDTPIVDTTGTLLDSDIVALATTITDGDHVTGDRTSVLVIPTTDAEPIADYAHRVEQAWSLDSAKEKNVLIVVATDDHALRISLSPLLQQDISDASAQAIGDNFMVPSIQDGDLYGALDFGISSLQAAAGGQSFDPSDTDDSGAFDPGFVGPDGTIVDGFDQSGATTAVASIGAGIVIINLFIGVVVILVVVGLFRGYRRRAPARDQRRYFMQHGTMAGYIAPAAFGAYMAGPTAGMFNQDTTGSSGFSGSSGFGDSGASTSASAGGSIGSDSGSGSSGGSSDSGGATSSW